MPDEPDKSAPRWALTTSQRPDEGLVSEVEALGRRFGISHAPRGDLSLEQLFRRFDTLLVVGQDIVSLANPTSRLAFAARMAELRIKRLHAGEHDPLVSLVGACAGARILDATAGLMADSLVLAATGAFVAAVESSRLLAAFASAGLARLEGQAGLRASSIHLECADHRAVLADATPGSFEVIYFDPMFSERPAMESGFDLFRDAALGLSLSTETLERARAVATRSVIVKDGPWLTNIRRLAPTPDAVTRGQRVRFARYSSTFSQSEGG